MRRLSARHQVYVARIGYFLCGFAVACWAPLIPIIQDHLSLSTEAISLLVLSFGIGSVSGMFLSGILLQVIGFKATYAISCFTTAASICLLALMPSYEIVFASLIVFGVSIGCLEVVINVFAAYIEKKYRIMMMSILFGYYSMGEVVGALMMMFLLTLQVSPSMAILSLISIIYVASAYYIPVIISIKSEDKKENKTFVKPVQPVISLALIIAFTYTVGGAILDWSGLYVTKEAGVPLNFASYGYCIVAGCMLLCRLFSKAIIRVLGTFNFAFYGALLMVASLFLMVLIPNLYVITLCFFAIGIGMSNISPLVTSATGAQTAMPLVPAISFLSICGYTGLLLGPAILGSIASYISLSGIFYFLSGLTALSALLIYTRKRELEAIDPRYEGK